MSATNDGGQAFPTHGNGMFGEPVTLKNGMTLRDWFAGQALAGMASSAFWAENFQANRPTLTSEVADAAYAMADAMLKARGGTP